MDTENNAATQEAPVVESAQSEQVAETEDSVQSPDDSADKDLILGKFKSPDDVVKSYQELEREHSRVSQNLNDPNFIYQKAVELGMAEQEPVAQEEPTEEQRVAPQVQQPLNVLPLVQDALDYEKTIEKYPELKSDANLRVWAEGLVNQGKTHSQAAEIIMKQLGKLKDVAKAEGANSAETTISEKEKAQTISSSLPTDAGAEEYARLVKQSKSLNPTEQKEAMIELLKYKNKKDKIV